MHRFLLGLALLALARAVPREKPFILFAAYPLVGHTTPLVFQAAEVARRGIASRVVVANTAFIGSPQAELAQMFTSPSGEAYGLNVEFVEVGFVNVTAKTVSKADLFVTGKDRVRAALDMIGYSIATNAKPLFDGLMATFGSSDNRPDILVCDIASIGCHEFASAIGVPLVLNNADVLLTAPWHWLDWTSVYVNNMGGVRTAEAVAAEQETFTSLVGLPRRLLTTTFVNIFWLFCLYANSPYGYGNSIWPNRSADLPPLGAAVANADQLILQNTFFPLEEPQTLPPHFVLTGPIFSTALMNRGRSVLAHSKPAVQDLLLDDDLRVWLEGSTEPVVYISFGTVFSLQDPLRVVSLVEGFLKAGARVVWKTHAIGAVSSALRAAGVLPPLVNSTSSIFLTRWVVSQLDVLSHPSISLFLSHCGTNSALESITLGTPVLCLPFGQTQVITGVHLVRVGASVTFLDLYSEDLGKEAEDAFRATMEKYDAIVSASRVLLKHIVVAGGAKRAVDELECVLAHNGTAYRSQLPAHALVRGGADVHITVVLLVLALAWGLTKCCRCLCRKSAPSESEKQKND